MASYHPGHFNRIALLAQQQHQQQIYQQQQFQQQFQQQQTHHQQPQQQQQHILQQQQQQQHPFAKLGDFWQGHEASCSFDDDNIFCPELVHSDVDSYASSVSDRSSTYSESPNSSPMASMAYQYQYTSPPATKPRQRNAIPIVDPNARGAVPIRSHTPTVLSQSIRR